MEFEWGKMIEREGNNVFFLEEGFDCSSSCRLYNVIVNHWGGELSGIS